MKKSCLFLLTLLVLLFISCSSPATHDSLLKIELDKNIEDYPTMDESDISINYKIFTFEGESTKQIIPKIDKLIRFDGNVYILSKVMGKGGLYIFKEDGTFIKKLSSGKGRGEFFAACDFITDESKKRLEVLDKFCAIYSYSLGGDFISKSSFPQMDVSSVKQLLPYS
ncbi:MAG: 6-bladed beta-propeller [Rikenellaceae bacterium]